LVLNIFPILPRVVLVFLYLLHPTFGGFKGAEGGVRDTEVCICIKTRPWAGDAYGSTGGIIRRSYLRNRFG
jgi:hypothetical protein